ncbi:MAG: PHP domain-containing protein [Candidatus Heimdallarchaeota archaeon]
MNINLRIKNNKFFAIVSIFFLVWTVFLIIILIIGEKNIRFYDALGQVDVSSNYSIKFPILRYIIEPFASIAFILEYEYTWMFLFLIFYPILRGFYLFLKKRGKFNSEKYRYITYPLVDIISFCFKVLTLTVLVVGLIVLIGFLIQGYFFASRYFMIPLQIGIHLSMILIAIKVGYTLLKLFHPNLKLHFSKKISKQNKKVKRRSQSVKQEIVLYIGIGALLLGSNIVLISSAFPPTKIVPIVPLENDEFLVDLHVHTIMSDGYLTVEERVHWYMQLGISIAAFSDHDNIRGATLAQAYVAENNLDLVVLMAEEWTQNANNPGEIHMNYYGIAEEIVPLESYTPGGPVAMNASDTISYVKANGGYITVNHYNYRPNPNGGYGVPYNVTQLRDWGVDGFEIANSGSYSGKYEDLRDFCMANNLICMGGSDIHINEDLNTFVKLKLADPTNLTFTNIFETLKNNTHEVIAIEFNPKIIDFPGDLNDFGFYVLEDFINYIFNIDMFQALSWLIWSALIYIIFFLAYRKLKRVDLKILKNKIL